MTQTQKNLSRKELRNFGLTTGGIVAALFGILFPWLLERPTPLWPWILGGILVLWGLAAPASLQPVYKGWMRFGLIMSRITTPIILAILFYLTVLPTGLIRRLMGYDSMSRAFDKNASSYRITSHRAPKQNLRRPF